MAQTKPKPLDLDKLKSLADTIAKYPNGPDSELVKYLAESEGLKLSTVKKTGHHKATMAGLSAEARLSEAQAVINWANAARRAIKDAPAQAE